MSRNSSPVKLCACTACTGLRAKNIAPSDCTADPEKVGLVRGFKEIFQNPRVTVFTITVLVTFVLLLLFVLNVVPWGTGRGCWAQC